MRLTLTLEFTRSDDVPERESTLDALVEKADVHPEVERRAGFRRGEDW